MNHAPIRPYFLAIFTVLLIILTVYLFRPFLITLGLAAVFAVLLDPLNLRLRNRLRLSKGFAAAATLVLGLIVIGSITGVIGSQLFLEAQQVYVSVSEPGSLARTQQTIVTLGVTVDRYIPGAGVYITNAAANLDYYAHQSLRWAIAHAGGVFSGTIHFIIQLFVFILTLYYLLKEGAALRRSVIRLSPLTEDETAALLARLVRTSHSVVRGSLVIALIQGALAALGFYIFGVPNAILWGTVTIFAALIPSVGSGFVVIPAAMYLVATGHTGSGIGLALWGVLGIGLIDNLLRPYLLAGRASVHPLLILLSILGGLALFGPAGIFLGPLIISLLIGLLSIYAPEDKEPETVVMKKA